MQHLLQSLSLPDRFESLAAKLGIQVAQVLVPPTANSIDLLERASLAINTRNEGIFLPIYGRPGSGKTTFINSLVNFFPAIYRPTAPHFGTVTFDSLQSTAEASLRGRAPNDRRILPIALDDRERNPPREEELAAIKAFVRRAQIGVQPILLWPDTDEASVDSMAQKFTAMAGDSPVSIPVRFNGPDRATWQDIAINTLRVANGVESLEELGVNPRDYDPAEFHSLGDFLRRISTDFDDHRFKLLRETQRPITLVFVFCSESQEPGVLTQLTSATRYGLADGHALLGVTRSSQLGRWWSARSGLLTRAILQLNIHLFSLPPGASVEVLRRHGPDDVKKLLDGVGIKAPGIGRLNRDVARTDLGKFLQGVDIRAYEARGTPAKVSVDAYKKLAARGFTYGKDKLLNKAFCPALKDFLSDQSTAPERIVSEQALGFVSLLPDSAIYRADGVTCLEYHWRTGEFLRQANRAEVASYVLRKTRDYVRQLAWVTD
jgi:hypothetical protein